MLETFVYFARGHLSGLIKIGFSNNPHRRVKEFCSRFDQGESADVLFMTPGGRGHERNFHRQFRPQREKGEWFRENGKLSRFIKMALKDSKKYPKTMPEIPTPVLLMHRANVPTAPHVMVAQVIGYARVSTDDQVLDVQIDALKAAGCERIFAETISAVSAKRPQYHLMRKYIESGDVLVVNSFSRLSRDLKQILTIVDELKGEGVKIRSLSETHIDPYTTSGRMVLSLTGAIDENERGRVRDRTKAAMQLKIREGMYIGAPTKVSPADAKIMKRMRFKQNIKVPKIAKKFGVSASAVYQHT